MNVELHRFNEAVIADPAVIDSILDEECSLSEVVRNAKRLGYDFTESEVRSFVRCPSGGSLQAGWVDDPLVHASGWTHTSTIASTNTVAYQVAAIAIHVIGVGEIAAAVLIVGVIW